jgi:endogenous inhibitor of DNA gyrase (YacG/DUF329 family)
MASRTHPAAPTRPCPICGKPAVPEHRPFCSPRCRQVDLHKWLTGSYAIPVVEEDGGEGGDD